MRYGKASNIHLISGAKGIVVIGSNVPEEDESMTEWATTLNFRDRTISCTMDGKARVGNEVNINTALNGLNEKAVECIAEGLGTDEGLSFNV
jgi:hypothetical protein